MCGNTKMQNTDVWKLLKFAIPMFRKSQNLEFQSLERAKMWNSNLRKTPKCKIAKFKKGKIWDSNVWKKENFRIPMFGKVEI